LFSEPEHFLYLWNQIVPLRIPKLAASANISHDAVDPCVFFFKDLLERGI